MPPVWREGALATQMTRPCAHDHRDLWWGLQGRLHVAQVLPYRELLENSFRRSQLLVDSSAPSCGGEQLHGLAGSSLGLNICFQIGDAFVYCRRLPDPLWRRVLAPGACVPVLGATHRP